MREVRSSFLDSGYDGGVGRADAGHGDAGTEVDEGVAVDVADDAAVGVFNVNGDARGDACSNDGGATLGQCLRFGAGGRRR